MCNVVVVAEDSAATLSVFSSGEKVKDIVKQLKQYYNKTTDKRTNTSLLFFSPPVPHIRLPKSACSVFPV